MDSKSSSNSVSKGGCTSSSIEFSKCPLKSDVAHNKVDSLNVEEALISNIELQLLLNSLESILSASLVSLDLSFSRDGSIPIV